MTTVLIDATIWAGEHDMSGEANQVSVALSRDGLDRTTFGSNGWRERNKGLFSGQVDASAFTDFTDDGLDEEMFGNLAFGPLPFAVTVDGTEGSVGYFFHSVETSVESGAQVGEIHELQISSMTSGDTAPAVRGRLETIKAARSTSSNSTGSQLGALSATQSIYSALHVFATTGSPTLDVIIQSDDNGSFTTPTTRITHAQATGRTSELLSATGAVVDDFWRASWTFGGSGTITFAVLLGIV